MAEFHFDNALNQAVAASGGATTVCTFGRMTGFGSLTVFAKIVGAANASVTFTVQCSVDDDVWFDAPFVALNGASEDTLVSTLTVAADGVTVAQALIALAALAPYVRVTMAGASTGTAVVSLSVVAI